ncbi:lysylphosphatidylglycerol synthase domain-containing protein, partial [Streptomyces sp. NPDC057654]|uniref:lysylphosphatidylglycerol synthase domain-containing protein n=1 Tax=Streptomyces sp. NPDC057654 TaxID=3346196 RepID=UPI0036A080B0
GSAVPTPGGVGTVEIALTTALTLAGMPADAALSAVLVFRLMVFWLPVIPGWISFTYLTRKGAI